MKKLFSLILALAILFTVTPLSGLMGIDWPESDLATLFNPVADAQGEKNDSFILGDVDGNGKVESADARLVLRASVALEQFTESQNTLADVDFDNKVTSADARLVLRASVGLEELSKPVHEHTFVTTVIDATCTEKGYTEKKCSVCGYTEKSDETDAVGHKWDDGVITKAATCKEDGVRTFTCTVCKETKTETVKGDHAYVATVVKPTCTEKGYTETKCSVCGKTEKSDYTDALGHKWDDGVITKEATCKEDGVRTFTCMVCKETKTEAVKGDHAYVKTVVNPTCTEKGYTETKCSVCGVSEKSDYTDALGHKWDDGVITKAATCKEDGVRTFTCTVCKETKTEAVKGDHSYVKTVVNPTCTEKGYTETKCSVCGVSEKSDYTDALGHKWDDGVITTGATCTQDGIRTFTCTVCQATKTETIKSSHTLVSVDRIEPTVIFSGNIAYYHCSVCGQNFSDNEAQNPVSDVVLPPTVSQEPLTAKEIYNTAVNYTVEINVVGKDFSATGTGFVYSSDGQIITNYHVIDEATSITVTDINGDTYDCINIIGYDETLDIAIIQVDASDLTVAPICEEYETGDVIYTLGSSKGLSFTIAEGLISNQKRELPSYNPGVYYIQISAPISSGNSGGPLIDVYGRVIGINTLSHTEGQNLNFAIPVSYISQVAISTISASEFYAQNNTETKRTAFNAIASLIKEKGEYVDSETPYYFMQTIKKYESYTVYLECIYWIADPENRNSEKISFRYNYRSTDINVYSRTTNVYITPDLFITGQFVIRDLTISKSYYSYFLIDPESFIPNQAVFFMNYDAPEHWLSEEKKKDMEQFAGYDATTALLFAQSIFDYFGFKYGIADLGFVNF